LLFEYVHIRKVLSGDALIRRGEPDRTLYFVLRGQLEVILQSSDGLTMGRVARAEWILRYISPVTGKTREMGLGAVAQVSLAQARVKANDARGLASKGIDPVEAKRPTRAKTIEHVPSFGMVAENFFELNKSRYRNFQSEK
jgi:hypothetical protein